MSKAQTGKTGEKASRWNGGVSIQNLIARRTGAYKRWKRESLERADYRCEGCGTEHDKICDCCGIRVRLHVHHIESFAKYPDKRFDPKNSEVLCPKCHQDRHK